MPKGKQHNKKLTIRVTPQTAYNLDRLAQMGNLKSPGRVVDKLTREKMLSMKSEVIKEGVSK